MFLTNTEVHIEALLQLLGSPSAYVTSSFLRVILWYCQRLVLLLFPLQHVNLLLLGRGDNPVDEDPGQVNVVRVNKARLDDILGFDDCAALAMAGPNAWVAYL